jgi:hypothetical protein
MKTNVFNSIFLVLCTIWLAYTIVIALIASTCYKAHMMMSPMYAYTWIASFIVIFVFSLYYGNKQYDA